MYISSYGMGERKGRKQGRKEGRREGRKEGEKIGEERGRKQGETIGEERGIKKGLAEGEMKKAVEIAAGLKEKRVDSDIIAEVSGLSKEQIERIPVVQKS